MELMIRIAKIIVMILEGISASIATEKVAKESGINYSKLWSLIPHRYR